MFASQWHLRKAPIVEAVFEIRTSGGPQYDQAHYEAIVKNEASAYPNARTQFDVSLTAQFGSPGPGLSSSQRVIGILLQTSDEKQMLQIGERGLAINRLAPYSSWAEIRPELMRVIDAYLTNRPGLVYERAAIRTINRIEIEDESASYSDVLGSPPTFPASASMDSDSFLMRHEMSDRIHPVRAVAYQASVPPVPGGARRAIAIDIDVYRDASLGLTGEALMETFEMVHEVKNRIFRAAVTPSWMERYE